MTKGENLPEENYKYFMSWSPNHDDALVFGENGGDETLCEGGWVQKTKLDEFFDLFGPASYDGK